VSEPLPFNIERAAHALGLDAATAEAVEALDAAGIESVLIKGPATVRWLYSDQPDARVYLDIDLAVGPEQFAPAEQVIAQLGYVNPLAGFRERELAWLHEAPWERPGSPPVKIDLHRGFHGVGDRAEWWAVLRAHTEDLQIAGKQVQIPDAAGCALIVTLHDTAVGRGAKSAEDLRRALTHIDESTWSEAARRAALVDALPSFVAGLSRHDTGRAIIGQLRLPTDLPAEELTKLLASEEADPLDVGRAWTMLHRLSRAQTRSERVRTLLGMIFPSAESLRESRPLARRGPLGLGLVRVTRPLVLLAQSPRVLVLVLRARREARHRNLDRPSEL
jgi:hypothetical protein